MKCTNCGMEWSGPAAFTSKINTCPFCGKSLQPVRSQFSSMDEVLSYTVGKFGIEIMRDGVKLQSYFADLAPHLKKEKIMLRHFIECDGHIVLLKAVREEPREAQARINSVIQRMEDDLMVMPEVAKSVCLSFWIAIGGDKGSIENVSHTVYATTVATAPANPTVAPAIQPTAAVQSEKTDESWRRSEAAHRQWLQSQSAPPKKQVLSGPSSLVDVLEQRRLQMAHDHWSKPQNNATPNPTTPPPAPKPVEDWKRSEAAHRAWLNSQQNKK